MNLNQFDFNQDESLVDWMDDNAILPSIDEFYLESRRFIESQQFQNQNLRNAINQFVEAFQRFPPMIGLSYSECHLYLCYWIISLNLQASHWDMINDSPIPYIQLLESTHQEQYHRTTFITKNNIHNRKRIL